MCGSQLLGQLRIRFSQVSVLNDADEFQPPFKGVATRPEIEKTVRERFRLNQSKGYAEVYKTLAPDQADKFIDEMVLRSADKVEANYENSVREVYERLDRNFGVSSLSETITSRLMWSFYGDGGRSFAIEFDPANEWFNAKKTDNDSFRHLRPVQYVADRKPDYLLATKDDDLLYTKALEWDFEKEWRIIRNFNDAVEQAGPDFLGRDILLFEIPPSAVRSVILGYRTSPTLENELRGVVAAKDNLKHVVFKRAVREANGHIEIVSA